MDVVTIYPQTTEENKTYWYGKFDGKVLTIRPPLFFSNAVIVNWWEATISGEGRLGEYVTKHEAPSREEIIKLLQDLYSIEVKILEMIILNKFIGNDGDPIWIEGSDESVLEKPTKDIRYIVSPPLKNNIYSSKWYILKYGDVVAKVDNIDEVKEVFEKQFNTKVILKNKEKFKKENKEMPAIKDDKVYVEVGQFPSKSSPGKYYTVKISPSDGEYTCNCPQWIFNKRNDRTCKHTDVLIGNKRERKVQAATPKQVKEMFDEVDDVFSQPNVTPLSRKGSSRKILFDG